MPLLSIIAWISLTLRQEAAGKVNALWVAEKIENNIKGWKLFFAETEKAEVKALWCKQLPAELFVQRINGEFRTNWTWTEIRPLILHFHYRLNLSSESPPL